MLRWFLASIAVAATVASASAAFIVTTPSIGPYPTGASYTAWQANAVQGLVNGGATGGVAFGNAALPSYYAPGSATVGPAGYVVPGGMINGIDSFGGGVTNVWQGQVNTPFAGETGQWAFYGVSVVANNPGEFFSANDVNFLGYNYAGFGAGYAATNLGSVVPTGNLVGVPFGGGPLQTVTNPADPYQEMYYIGVGAGYFNNFGPFYPDYQDQGTLESLFNSPDTPNDFLTGQWTVNSNAGLFNSNVASMEINGAVPVPATVVFMGLGLAGLVARVRRKVA